MVADWGVASGPFQADFRVNINHVIRESFKELSNPPVGLRVGVEAFKFAHAQHGNVHVPPGAAAQKSDDPGVWGGFAYFGEHIRIEEYA